MNLLRLLIISGLLCLSASGVDKVEIKLQYEGLNTKFLSYLAEVQANVKDGVVILPSLNMRNGVQGTAGATKEYVFPSGDEFETLETGVTSKFKTRIDGDEVRVFGSITFRRPIYRAEKAGDKVRRFASFETREIFFDETMLVDEVVRFDTSVGQKDKEFLVVEVRVPVEPKKTETARVEQVVPPKSDRVGG